MMLSFNVNSFARGKEWIKYKKYSQQNVNKRGPIEKTFASQMFYYVLKS